MRRVRMLGIAATALLFGLAAVAAPMPSTTSGRPGTVNYIEGQVSLNGGQIGPDAIGKAVLDPGQVLETGQGRAEVLLTPGVFMRVGANSAVRMDRPDLADTQVAVLRGEAMVEVTQLFKANHLQFTEGNASVTISKVGLYQFNADRPMVAAFKGEALVTEDGRHTTLKSGKEIQLSQGLHAQSFSRDAHDDLYNFSSLRSQYMAEAGAEYAQTVVVGAGSWWGPGWYWNPWWGAYSFIPGDGILYSPFGWGFYSPGFVGYAPGYYGVRGVYPRGVVRGGVAASTRFGGTPAIHSFGGGGFHGGGGFGGGGFHGGGGRR